MPLVSCADQEADLLRQNERLEAHLSNTPNSLGLTDLGSGLNFKKRGLTKLLALVMAGRVEKIVITHKDRLMRFGYELFEQVVQGHGEKIEMLENVSSHDETELAHDVLAIITVFSAILYGRRSDLNTPCSSPPNRASLGDSILVIFFRKIGIYIEDFSINQISY
jgi:putative resolvase